MLLTWVSLVAQVVENLPACSAGGPGLIPGLGISPGEGNWRPTPVFLPGEFHGQKSLAGYSPWGLKESDTTEWLTPFIYFILLYFIFLLRGLLGTIQDLGININDFILSPFKSSEIQSSERSRNLPKPQISWGCDVLIVTHWSECCAWDWP